MTDNGKYYTPQETLDAMLDAVSGSSDYLNQIIGNPPYASVTHNKRVDWRYPLMWRCSPHDYFKSLWLGWVLITWRWEDGRVRDLCFSFQPGL